MTSTELSNASKVMLGSTEASAMYIGSSLIWLNRLSPYDCMVEYIESTGTQFIDTLYKPSPNTSFDSTMLFVANSNKNVANVNVTFLGASNEESGYYLGFNFGERADLYREIFFWGNKTYASGGTAISRTFNESDITSKFQFHYQSGSVTMANLSITPQTATHTFTTLTLTLFGGRNTAFNRWNLRIYAFKIYDNGVLVRDFIPVRVGLVGYMYDKITKQLFGNLGTGSFTLGPDIVEVEYLESTGTLYINTDYQVWNYGLSGEIKMLRIGDHTGYDGYIGRTTSGGLQLYYRSGMGIVLWLDRGSNNFDIPTNSSYYDTNIHVVLFGITSTTSYVSVDGDTYSVTDSLDTRAKAPILLFSHRGYYNAEGRIYYCKLYDNDISVLDLIPVRIGQVGYMYDKISNKLFGNSGSGTFTLGPDKQ